MQIQCKLYTICTHLSVVISHLHGPRTCMNVYFLHAVYTNRDGLTGFGMPWEIRFQSNYTILRKGGNVGGYSALFSFVPELQLSKW